MAEMSAGSPERTQRLRRAACHWPLIAVLAAQAACLAWQLCTKSPRTTEPKRLASGLEFLRSGAYHDDFGNTPLAGSIAALAVWPERPKLPARARHDGIPPGQEFARLNEGRIGLFTTLGRLALVPFTMLATCVAYHWAREVFGRTSGAAAALVLALHPLSLSEGTAISGDAAVSGLLLWATYQFWRWSLCPTYCRACAAGALSGLAVAAKFVALMLAIVWPVLFMLTLFRREAPAVSAGVRRVCRQGLAGLACGVLVVNAAFGFAGTLRPVADSIPPQYRPGIPAALAAVLDRVPWPLPRDFTDSLVQTVVSVQFTNVALPEHVRLGHEPITFFARALLATTPLGILALGLLSVAVCLRGHLGNHARFAWICALVGGMTLLACISGANSRILYVRYALPVIPFLAVAFAAPFADRVHWQRMARHSTWRAAGALSLFCAFVPVLKSMPHSECYMNALSGTDANSPISVPEHCPDTGQDLGALKRWLDQNPQAAPLSLAYYGSIHPNQWNIEFEAANIDLGPKVPASAPFRSSGTDEVRWYAVSDWLLRGFPAWQIPAAKGGWVAVAPSDFAWLRGLKPVATVGCTIHIFKVNAGARSITMAP